MTSICIRVIRDLLDISREVILWEVREVTIDEYPVFLLHLSQPDLHMEYIPKGYLSKRDILIWKLLNMEYIPKG